jgi:hypothetical protein
MVLVSQAMEKTLSAPISGRSGQAEAAAGKKEGNITNA